MPKRILTLVILLLFFSCTKDKGRAPSEESTPDESIYATKDDIVYTDFEPDIVLNSITGQGPLYPGGPKINFPTDTTCSVSIKILPSDTFSFVFSAENYYQWASNSGPSANYNYYLILYTTNKFDSLAKKGDFVCPLLLGYQKKIGPGFSYSRSNSLWLCQHVARMKGIGSFSGLPFNCSEFSGDTYISFKRTEGKKVFYGWLHIERIGENGVKIKEVAINLGSNRPILAGQKQ